MSHTPPTHPRLGPPVERSIAGSDSGDRPTVTVDLGVRSLSPAVQPLLDDAVNRLREAVDGGAVDTYNLTVLGESFDPTAAAAGTEAGQRIAQRVREIRHWAEREGVSISPYFTEETIDCRLSGAHYCRVQFPSLCLAEYHDGDLAFVAPIDVDGERVDVIDRLEALVSSASVPPQTPVLE